MSEDTASKASPELPEDDAVTLDELKAAVAEGVKLGVAEGMKALKTEEPKAPEPAEPAPAKAVDEVVKEAVAEAVAKTNEEWQTKLDRTVAEFRQVRVGGTRHEPEEVTVQDLALPAKGLRLRGVAGVASDLLYMEMIAKGYSDTKRCALRDNPYVMKALDTATDGSGGDYIPEGFSDQFVLDVQAALQLPALFPRVAMPTKELTLPVTPTSPTAYLAQENTTRATEIPDGAPGTRNVKLSAVKLAVRTIQSFEYDQDAWPIALQMIRDSLVRGLSEGLEDAIVNGDTSTTHIDADVTSPGDRRKAFFGLRAKAIEDISRGVDLGTFDADVLNELPAQMGRYGVDFRQLVWIVGTAGWAKLRLLRDAKDNPLVVTVDKYGPQASILSGEVGRLFGSPVIYSPFVREDLNAQGVYDGTTVNKTAILCVWYPAWLLGDRMDITMEVQRFAASQNSDVVLVWRGDFKHALAGEPTTVVGYNLAR
jgi:HK97 family phage major capsid protein